MSYNNGKMESGRALPGALVLMVMLVSCVPNLFAQTGYLSATTKFTIDPRHLGLESLSDRVQHDHPVFQQTVSFWVNLWTDNSVTVNSDAVVYVVNRTTNAGETIARYDNLTNGTALKLSAPGAESTDSLTTGSGVTTTTVVNVATTYAVTQAIEFRLEKDKLSVVITSTVAGLTRKTEIQLGTLSLRNLFDPFSSGTHLDGKNWLVGEQGVPLPGAVSVFAPASTNSFLDRSAFGTRGFIDRRAWGTQTAWMVTGYSIYRGYQGGSLVSITIQPEYAEIRTNGVMEVLFQKSYIEQAYEP